MVYPTLLGRLLMALPGWVVTALLSAADHALYHTRPLAHFSYLDELGKFHKRLNHAMTPSF
jgi:hypothetical protein